MLNMAKRSVKPDQIMRAENSCAWVPAMPSAREIWAIMQKKVYMPVEVKFSSTSKSLAMAMYESSMAAATGATPEKRSTDTGLRLLTKQRGARMRAAKRLPRISVLTESSTDSLFTPI